MTHICFVKQGIERAGEQRIFQPTICSDLVLNTAPCFIWVCPMDPMILASISVYRQKMLEFLSGPCLSHHTSLEGFS